MLFSLVLKKQNSSFQYTSVVSCLCFLKALSVSKARTFIIQIPVEVPVNGDFKAPVQPWACFPWHKLWCSSFFLGKKCGIFCEDETIQTLPKAQRPEGWVQFTKVTCLSHITSSRKNLDQDYLHNLDQASTSKFKPYISISTKLKLKFQNIDQT